jgi:hypothetical protein
MAIATGLSVIVDGCGNALFIAEDKDRSTVNRPETKLDSAIYFSFFGG